MLLELQQVRKMLNKHQQLLVDSTFAGGIIIGEACPGSGKTRTMEVAVSELIESGVNPSRIGIFTFSRKSAAEARRRIAQTIIPDISPEELKALEEGSDEAASDIFGDSDPRRDMLRNWVCTIHGMSFRILKANGVKVRVPDGKLKWEIDAIVKDGIKELEWDESPRSVWRWIGIGINNMISPAISKDAYIRAGLSRDQAYNQAILYQRYIKFMRSNQLVDFDMMQADLVHLIRSKQIDISGMFDYVFIDEAQDNNPLQNEIIAALTTEASLIMIGDVDQSIYAFRGSKPDVMRQFDNAVYLNLPINYRSTQKIVQTSAKLIANSYNDDKSFLKPFQWRPDAPIGSNPTFTLTEDFDELTSEIIELIEQRNCDVCGGSGLVDSETGSAISNEMAWRGGAIECSNCSDETRYGDIAILSRTRAECAAIHTSLVAAGIPAINHSGGLLFGSLHIRKVLAYAHLACNYNNARDNLEILSEIANVSSGSFRMPYSQGFRQKGDWSHVRFYGRKSIEKAGNWQGIQDQQYVGKVNERNGAKDLVSFVTTLEKYLEDARLAINIIIELSVKPWLAAEEGLSEDDLSENGKLEDFALLLDMCEPDMSLEKFIDRVEWLTKQSQNSRSEAVNIGTIHWSKGAEFSRVILNLTRCPIKPPPSDPNKLPTGRPPTIDEERRLAFVGATRAKDELMVVASQKWLDQTLGISQFIGEMGL